MNSDKLFSAELFWQFSCQLYASNDIKTLCLEAQNCHGLNINIILLTHWLNIHGKALSTASFSELFATIEASDAQLKVLRVMRNKCERGSPEYKNQLNEELVLEQQQQALLMTRLKQLDVINTQQHCLADYAHSQGCDAAAWLDTLINALRKVSTGKID